MTSPCKAFEIGAEDHHQRGMTGEFKLHICPSKVDNLSASLKFFGVELKYFLGAKQYDYVEKLRLASAILPSGAKDLTRTML